MRDFKFALWKNRSLVCLNRIFYVSGKHFIIKCSQKEIQCSALPDVNLGFAITSLSIFWDPKLMSNPLPVEGIFP